MARKKLVLLGMISKHPVAGVIWQVIHYLVGFQRLGYDTYYVEAGAHQPSSMLAAGEESADDERSSSAAALIDRVMRRFDLGDHWAFHALHADRRCYGLSETQLKGLYNSAALIINLHGGTTPRPEHSATGRLVYLETDPVMREIQLHDQVQEAIDYLAPHCAFFTFAENYGNPDCRLPVSDRFRFRPTRQPVLVDLWHGQGGAVPATFTTVGNWRQPWRDVTLDGELYHWSKDQEFLKFLDLPTRTQQSFELALSRCGEADARLLKAHGWCVRDALTVSLDMDTYRAYIVNSRGEFTVAKDQNVRLRSGWFSDRAATYLAAGRPVVTQETGFSNILPTGEGLFGFSTIDEAAAAVECINAEYGRQSRAATALAHGYFNYDVVLGPLLKDLGL